MNDNIIQFPAPTPCDRTVIAFATVESRDWAADDFLDLEVRAVSSAGSGPVIEIGRYEIPLDRLPVLLRAVGRMAALFGSGEEVSA